MYSREKIESLLPGIRQELAERLASNPIPNVKVDDTIRERYCWLQAQARLGEAGFEATGGMWTENWAARHGADFLLRIYDRLEKLERAMGIGALARAQTAQLTANANLSHTEVQAAQERLRQRQALKVLPGGS